MYFNFTECHPGSWGVNCLNKCRCKNGGTCDPVTGECICADGWYGRECEEGKSNVPCCWEKRFTTAIHYMFIWLHNI